jgi:hypothetical protein
MSEDQKKAQLFTLPIEYVYEILRETEDQIVVSSEHLREFLTEGDKSVLTTSLMTKLLWLNFAIIELLNESIEEPSYHQNEETGEDEYLVDEETIYALQNFMLTRFYTNTQLNKLSFSTCVH